MNTMQVVNDIGGIRLSGNTIPHTWYERITRENGKPYLEAIIVLADILYWYTPTEVLDEQTGKIVEVRKKFAADKLQRSYGQLVERFGFGKDQARNAVKHLVAIGAITTEFRTVTIGKMRLSNVQYMEPVPGKIRELSALPPISRKTDRVSVAKPIGYQQENRHPISRKTDTDTYTTTETTDSDDGGGVSVDNSGLDALLELGITAGVARKLAATCAPSTIDGWVRYVGKANSINDPAGFVVHKLKAGEPPPRASPRKAERQYVACPRCGRVDERDVLCETCGHCSECCACYDGPIEVVDMRGLQAGDDG